MRKGFVGLAFVLLACWGPFTVGNLARADDTNTNMNGGNEQLPPADQPEPPLPPENPENPNPAATPAPTPTYGPLMQAFESLGFGKGMEDLGFNIHGYIEGGYLYDMSVPGNQTPPKSAPGDEIFFAGDYKNEFMLNQVDIAIQRDMVNLPKGNWDFGFGFEGGYGRDFYFTHSNGILDQHNKQGGTGLDDQLDLLQAYGQIGIPVGTGITVEAGKFLSLLGYEKIDPTQNIFYTHSYGFGYGRPFTMTGILGAYTFTDEQNASPVTITGGITRGWNQSLYDNNGDIDGVMQLKVATQALDLSFNLMVGPEGVLPYGPADHSHWWLVPEGVIQVHLSDQLLIAGDFLYGTAPTLTQWFNAVAYAQYKIDPHVYLNGRIEYYHDGRGVTTGVGGTDINYWEATLGTTIVPLPDSPYLSTLAFRPEIRFDDADQPAFDFSKHSELTFAVDVEYRF